MTRHQPHPAKSARRYSAKHRKRIYAHGYGLEHTATGERFGKKRARKDLRGAFNRHVPRREEAEALADPTSCTGLRVCMRILPGCAMRDIEGLLEKFTRSQRHWFKWRLAKLVQKPLDVQDEGRVTTVCLRVDKREQYY
jgi:hypothetical protein